MGSPLHDGMFFIYIFFGLAPGVALLLIYRSVSRALREPGLRWTILLIGTAALALWVIASYLMLLIAFAVAWGVEHTQPDPPGFFPEGWRVYAFLGAYALIGGSLALKLGRVPRGKAE